MGDINWVGYELSTEFSIKKKENEIHIIMNSKNEIAISVGSGTNVTALFTNKKS